MKERLGPEPQWNRQRAERELGKRLDLVERERWARPSRETFAAFVAEWREVWLPSMGLKKSTREDYETTLDRHALPILGELPLDSIGPEHFDRYIATKLGEGLAAKTIAKQLATLSLVFDRAKRWKRITVNPLDEVDLPRLSEPETVVLSEAEVARLLVAYRELALRADDDERPWWEMPDDGRRPRHRVEAG